jgi:hypothetical protein
MIDEKRVSEIRFSKAGPKNAVIEMILFIETASASSIPLIVPREKVIKRKCVEGNGKAHPAQTISPFILIESPSHLSSSS